tara:strand:- start:127 stop:462 length:336 start_codon:yes stop_codon:yes gene_type:complete
MATNVFLSVGAPILASGGGAIYSGPGGSKQAVVHSIYVSNIDGTSSADVTIKAKNVSGDTYRHVAKDVPVPAGSSLVLDKPIDLSSTGIIHMEASLAGDLETVLGILEIDP